MKSALHYSDLQLDRADQARRDPDHIEALWQQSDCRLVPVYQDKNFIRDTKMAGATAKEADFTACLPLRIDLDSFVPETRIFLGLQGSEKHPVFAVAVTEAQQQSFIDLDSDSHFANIRSVGSLLENASASLLAYARGMIFWQQNHRFCSYCGSASAPRQGGHVMRCTNESCQQQSFPRTDPAVIMLVESHNEQGEPVCLLGRHPSWPEGVFSTLAGFVEPGESLEAAVRREVYEEAGVTVRDVQYLSSQPWPFPSSIMLGFIAQAESREITIDPQELAAAHWFSASEIKQFADWGSDHAGYKLPRTDSIARYLINHWLQTVEA